MFPKTVVTHSDRASGGDTDISPPIHQTPDGIELEPERVRVRRRDSDRLRLRGGQVDGELRAIVLRFGRIGVGTRGR